MNRVIHTNRPGWRLALLVALLLPFGFTQAASLSLDFDFTATPTLMDSQSAGSRMTFTDVGTGDYSVTASAWNYGGKTGLQPAELVSLQGTGLGVCSSSDGSLRKCLNKPKRSAIDGAGGQDFVLLLLSQPMTLDSIQFTPAQSKQGSVVYTTGMLDIDNITESLERLRLNDPLTFSYANSSAEQSVLLQQQEMRNAILIGTNKGSTRYTLTGFQGSIVPVPAAAWLMLSGLGVLIASAARRRG